MKAIVYTKYGPPDVLQLQEIEKPVLGEDEVLVKIHAASVNAFDWRFMRSEPPLVRFEAGLLKPKNTILGIDIAGRVEAIGRNTTQFKIGDEVFGEVSLNGFGGFAEYTTAPENAIVRKPANITFAEASAAPTAAFTAIQGLRDHGNIQSGQKVLINGASGGVGTFAVQVAKSFGAIVTGVCSTHNLDMVRSIGADKVIDHTQEVLTQSGQKYDLLFDAVGNLSVSGYKRLLRPGGRAVVAGFTTTLHLLYQVLILGSWVTITGGKKIGTMGSAKPNREDLVFIKELLETRTVVPVIDRCYVSLP